MASSSRGSHFRQGQVLSCQLVKQLIKEYPPRENSENPCAVVASHDCDLAAEPSKEPNTEIIIGPYVDQLDGCFSQGKNARRLHIAYQNKASRNQTEFIELKAANKCFIPKNCMEKKRNAIKQNLYLESNEVRILQRWLSARYSRAAYPEFFNQRLQEKNIPKKIGNILRGQTQQIHSLLFDLDQGKSIERRQPTDVYELDIVVLYYGQSDNEKESEKAAGAVVEKIESLFEENFYKQGRWSNIRLKDCQAVSNTEMTVAQKESLREWDQEYLSY